MFGLTRSIVVEDVADSIRVAGDPGTAVAVEWARSGSEHEKFAHALTFPWDFAGFQNNFGRVNAILLMDPSETRFSGRWPGCLAL